MSHETIESSQENPIKSILQQLGGINFETDRGSIYGFDENGHLTGTQRQEGIAESKLAHVEKGDITLFAQLSEEDYKIVADVLGKEENRVGEKLYVVELQPDGKPKVIRNISEISNPNNLYLGIQEKGGKFFTKPGSLLPEENSTYFSYKFKKDSKKKSEGISERFMGKVKKVIYK